MSTWSVNELVALFRTELAMSNVRGIDRLSPSDMLPRIAEEAEVVSRKVRAGTYKFAPYAQVLKSKGPRKYPREIAIPTARDRLALLRLKERIHETFSEHVPSALPNNLVRQALEAVQGADAAEKVCLRLDIQEFYDSVRHEGLLARLQRRLDPFEVRLARRAIRNATVPAGSRRDAVPRTRRHLGVPQGLAVSNVLADISLGTFDQVVGPRCDVYLRFVDDILAIVDRGVTADLHGFIRAELRKRGFECHDLEPRDSKGGIFGVDERIEFLGYVFDRGEVSVRASSVDRFMENIAARASRHRRESQRAIKMIKWMTRELADHVLIEELNERITGAISESRRYGWMFYFSALSDETLLFRLDRAIREMVPRLTGVNVDSPTRLKRLARAWHEVRHRPSGAYIHNYDVLSTTQQRLEFLAERGQVGPDEALNAEQVNIRFERYRQKQLKELEADLAIPS